MTASQGTSIQFHRILITSQSVSERDGRIVRVTIPRSSILRVQVLEEVISEHPARSFVLRFITVALPVWGLMTAGHAGHFYRMLATLLALLVFGRTVFEPLRRGLVLRIETTSGTRKLQLGSDVRRDHIPGFIEVAERSGLAIETVLPVALLEE